VDASRGCGRERYDVSVNATQAPPGVFASGLHPSFRHALSLRIRCHHSAPCGGNESYCGQGRLAFSSRQSLAESDIASRAIVETFQHDLPLGLAAFDQGMGPFQVGRVDGAEVACYGAAQMAGVHQISHGV